MIKKQKYEFFIDEVVYVSSLAVRRLMAEIRLSEFRLIFHECSLFFKVFASFLHFFRFIALLPKKYYNLIIWIYFKQITTVYIICRMT